MASWAYVQPGPNQIAAVLMRGDGKALQLVSFELTYLDHHGWHVRLHRQIETLIAMWRWRR